MLCIQFSIYNEETFFFPPPEIQVRISIQSSNLWNSSLENVFNSLSCVAHCAYVKVLEVYFESVDLCPYQGSILLKLLLSQKKNLPTYPSNSEGIYRRDQPTFKLSKGSPFTRSCGLQAGMGCSGGLFFFLVVNPQRQSRTFRVVTSQYEP